MFRLLQDYEKRPRPIGWEYIPWSLAEEAWEGYKKAGHGSQSLERIAERGGFSRQEVACALEGHYNDTSKEHTTCVRKLDSRLKGRPKGAPWWDDFEKPREGDSHAVTWARGYAGLYVTGFGPLTEQQAILICKAFLEMSKLVDKLQKEGQPNDPT
jgi:hypothetical protein